MKFLKSKVLKSIIRTIEIILIVFISCYILFILAQILSNNKSIFGYRLFTVSTGSMSGAYDIDDVILVKDINPNDLKKGDDIVYHAVDSNKNEMIISHRIVDIYTDEVTGEKYFVTKGIKNKVVDPTINSSQIYGKIETKITIITELNKVVNNKIGFFLVIFIPLLFIIVYEILKLLYGFNKEEESIKIKLNKKKDLKEDSSITIVEKETVENHE